MSGKFLHFPPLEVPEGEAARTHDQRCQEEEPIRSGATRIRQGYRYPTRGRRAGSRRAGGGRGRRGRPARAYREDLAFITLRCSDRELDMVALILLGCSTCKVLLRQVNLHRPIEPAGGLSKRDGYIRPYPTASRRRLEF